MEGPKHVGIGPLHRTALGQTALQKDPTRALCLSAEEEPPNRTTWRSGGPEVAITVVKSRVTTWSGRLISPGAFVARPSAEKCGRRSIF